MNDMARERTKTTVTWPKKLHKQCTDKDKGRLELILHRGRETQVRIIKGSADSETQVMQIMRET